MSKTANKDQLFVVWALKRLHWSDRRIARVKLPASHHTITDYYQRACEMIESGELPIDAMDERAVRIRYCGDSKDVEKIDAVRNSGVCGSGRRVKAHIYDSDFKDTSDEE